MKNLLKRNTRDFLSTKQEIKKLIQAYYPNNYNDINDTSYGMMMVDIVSAIGDNINFYLDELINESNINNSQIDDNVYAIAQNMYTYVPKTTHVSYVYATIGVIIPAINGAFSWTNNEFNISKLILWSSENISNQYINEDVINFSSNTNCTIENNEVVNGIVQNFLVTKTVKFISAIEKSYTIDTSTTPIRYYKINLPDTNVIQILKVEDIINNEEYYEVESLAQHYIIQNELLESESLYRINLITTNNKFKKYINSDKSTSLVFGSGIASTPDEYIVPNNELLGDNSSLINSVNTNLDVSNFLYTNAYGKIPFNTTLKITYTIGGGNNSKILANKLDKYSIEIDTNGVSQSIISTFQILNNTSGMGGSDGDTIDDIKTNAIGQWNAQKRIVNTQDYITYVLNMPEKYGKISKAYVDINSDYSAINLYVLGTDYNNNIVPLTDIIKSNLKKYLQLYRGLLDKINIIDAYIINFKLGIDITANSEYNKNIVLYNCINTLKEYFKITRWNINEPIYINKIRDIIKTVDGVQYINNIYFSNIWNDDNQYTYSGVKYNLSQATYNDIVYPPMDASIFYLKYPEINIKGQVR